MKPIELYSLVAALLLHSLTAVAAPTTIPPSTPAKRATTIPVDIETAKVSNITTTLGLRRWPNKQYTVSLRDGWFLAISAESYTLNPRPASPAFQQLIYQFSDDIEAAYPPPSLSPRRASLEYYDTDSFTEWGIVEAVDDIMGNLAPTEVLARALSRLAIDVGRYGPPLRLKSLILTKRNLPWILQWKQHNYILMGVSPMEARSRQANGVNATDDGFVSTF